jgi:hypothetical protein
LDDDGVGSLADDCCEGAVQLVAAANDPMAISLDYLPP